MNPVTVSYPVERVVPTFDLRQLPDDDYPIWRHRAVERVEESQSRLRKVAARVGRPGNPQDQSRSYILRAYRIAAKWEAEGNAPEMIFGATFLTNQSAFRREVDLFTAALRLGLSSDEARRVDVHRCARACKYAWLHRWDRDRLELELLRYGVSGIAKRRMGTMRRPIVVNHLQAIARV